MTAATAYPLPDPANPHDTLQAVQAWLDELLAQADALLAQPLPTYVLPAPAQQQAEQAEQQARQAALNQTMGYPVEVDVGLFYGFRCGSLSCIGRLLGTDHPHYRQFATIVSQAQRSCVRQGRSMLEGIRQETKTVAADRPNNSPSTILRTTYLAHSSAQIAAITAMETAGNKTTHFTRRTSIVL